MLYKSNDEIQLGGFIGRVENQRGDVDFQSLSSEELGQFLVLARKFASLGDVEFDQGLEGSCVEDIDWNSPMCPTEVFELARLMTLQDDGEKWLRGINVELKSRYNHQNVTYLDTR